ncbi:hypothetical protein [Komagataeibacter europaeus]|uniref:hypothetical protein n=1 Tax=Komagataeibacter europaeus TaxID=33995 RepID=UPI000B551ED9|nr:hypothetical protein [Komagataeibacter europaeus]ARW18342.1 hypothetical protein S101446_03268 [Komagataeibacter europaeus]
MNNKLENTLLRHIKNSIRNGVYFPNMVFVDVWDIYYLFPSDYLTGNEAADIIWSLMKCNGESLLCFVDVTTIYELKNDSISYINIDNDLYKDYQNMWEKDRDDSIPWLCNVDTYSASSTSGKWFLYSERDNEISMIALKGPDSIECFKACRNLVHAILPEDLEKKELVPGPFDRLDPKWIESFQKFYNKS